MTSSRRIVRKEDLPASLPSMWRLCRLGLRYEPTLMIWSFGLALLAAVPDALLALWFKLMADAVAAGDATQLRLTAFALAYRGNDDGEPAGSPSSLRCGSPDYEVPRRDRFGRKKIRRRRGAADQTRRVEKRGRALMTDVRAGRPVVTHPEHCESANRGHHRIRGPGHSRTDVRRVADDAHTGRLLLNVVRGDAEEGQVEDPDVDLA